MTTMKDIAIRAEVSTATVSRVLSTNTKSIPISEKTRRKVLSIAQEMEYKPNPFAKSLRTKRSFFIGVVVWDLTDPFYGEVLHGIEQIVYQRGYNLLLTTAEASKKLARVRLERMGSLRTDGILIVGGPKSFRRKEITELGVDTQTIVLVDTRAERRGVSSITVDNLSGGFIGAEYLIKLNRKSITYLAGEQKEIDMVDRLAGVKKAIEQYAAQNLFFIVKTGPGEQEGYNVTQKILARAELPLAVFAVNDIAALGVIRAVKDKKLRIPEDVAVLGFDDLSMANYLEPRLSTVHQPRLQMGRSGAQLLLELMDKKGAGLPQKYFHKMLSPRLVVREST